jgi:hypothetical protein
MKVMRSITLDESVALLASKEIKNLSSFCNNAIKIELKLKKKNEDATDEELIDDLIIDNAKLRTKIENLEKEIERLKKTEGFDIGGFRKA